MTDIQLRQTYRDKIYNYRPTWILRWGATFFFLFLLVVIMVSGFIKYPDIVPATAEITAINPPAHLVANVNGKIEQVLVSEGQAVTKGSILALLESSSRWNHILIIDSILSRLDTLCASGSSASLPVPSEFEKDLILGELQPAYSELLYSYTEFYQFHQYDFHAKKLSALTAKQGYQRDYINRLINKEKLLHQQFKISLNKYHRDSLMSLKGGVSRTEVEFSRQNVLQHQSTITDLAMSLINNQAINKQIGYEIETLTLEHHAEKQRLVTRLEQNIQLLKAQTDAWRNTYALEAPVDGVVSLTTFWSENQNVKAGEVVLSVVPTDSLKVKVRLQFPIQNSGKVSIGQRVNIKLENYPYQEFGMLVGSLENISRVPNDLLYSADVILDHGLETSYHKKLPKIQQLTGKAEILTDEVSLLMRFFNPLRAVFEEHF